MYFKCLTRLSLTNSTMIGQRKPGMSCPKLHILGSKARSAAPNSIFWASVWSLETIFRDSREEWVPAGIPKVTLWNLSPLFYHKLKEQYFPPYEGFLPWKGHLLSIQHTMLATKIVYYARASCT